MILLLFQYYPFSMKYRVSIVQNVLIGAASLAAEDAELPPEFSEYKRADGTWGTDP